MDAVMELLGNATVLSFVLFIIGIVLLGIEFFIPGFGVCGIAGIICLIADMIITAKSLAQAAVMLGVILLILCIFVVILLILGSKGLLPKFLVLGASEAKAEGYSATPDFTSLAGMEGAATTTLRPAGKAIIGGKVYDVVSGGDFIEAGTDVTVTSVEGGKIIVSKKI